MPRSLCSPQQVRRRVAMAPRADSHDCLVPGLGLLQCTLLLPEGCSSWFTCNAWICRQCGQVARGSENAWWAGGQAAAGCSPGPVLHPDRALAGSAASSCRQQLLNLLQQQACTPICYSSTMCPWPGAGGGPSLDLEALSSAKLEDGTR